MHVIAHSTEQQQTTAKWWVVIIAVFSSAITALASTLALFFIAAAFNIFPDARDGMFIFIAFVAALSGLSIAAGYSIFPVFSDLVNVHFTRVVRWAIFPVFVAIPIFIYTFIGVAYVHP